MAGRKLKFVYLTLTSAALALAACDSSSLGDITSGPQAAAVVTLQLTDSPGDLKEAWVKIDHFVLIREGGKHGNQDGEHEKDDDKGEKDDTSKVAKDTSKVVKDTTAARIELKPKTTDWVELLKLAGGKLQDITNGITIPPGDYDELRIVLAGAYVVTQDGKVFATEHAVLPAGVTATGVLQCPSCTSSGLKIKLDEVGVGVDAGTNTFIIDFDVNQSFGHEAGNSGRFILHPVLRATHKERHSDGSISGRVSLAPSLTIPSCGGHDGLLERFVPRAVAGADTLSGHTKNSGEFTIEHAPAKTYTMSYASELTFTNGDALSFTAAATPATVTVVKDSKSSVNYVVSAVSCKKKV
jgi:hypothetical protein